MFDKYFKAFQGNEQRGQRYQVVLSNGSVISGVPIAASDSVNSGSFDVRLDDGKTREVEWRRVLAAVQI